MRRKYVILAWSLILTILLYIYFFQPGIFEQLFQYPGAGSPFVPTPQE